MRMNVSVVLMACIAGCFSTVVNGSVAKTSDDIVYSVISPKVAESLLVDVAQVGDRMVAVGERGHIVYSDDQGEQWTQAKVPTRVLITSVFFSDAKHGWAVGHDAMILYSSDGGETWIEQYSDPHGSEKEVSGSALPELEETEIDEEEWVDDISRSGSPLLDVWFKNNKEGFAVGAYGYFLHTTDGGINWQDWTKHIDNQDGWHFNSMVLLPSGVLILAGEKGIIYRSENYGESWEQLNSPYEGSFFGVVATKSPNVALVFGLQGNIFRTADKGDTWKTIDSGVQTGLNSGVVLNDGSLLIVGNSGVVLTSVDGGNSFHKTIQSDRKSLVGVSLTNDDNFVLFSGQGGVKRVSTKSTSAASK